MSDFGQDVIGRRAQVLARLAALERMKEQSLEAGRAGMFCSIERLIEAETRVFLTLPANDSLLERPRPVIEAADSPTKL